ncbi:hypothetical protein M405DRAFT_867843 [Rhizopogon salebrosus TDB-379]|nr:hypothetical protein M405DRAFT_867843 [Rhizopogon salebrosus TDB-379]
MGAVEAKLKESGDTLRGLYISAMEELQINPDLVAMARQSSHSVLFDWELASSDSVHTSVVAHKRLLSQLSKHFKSLNSPRSEANYLISPLNKFSHPLETIAGVTPADYTVVLAFTSEKRLKIRAKSSYFADTREVTIMTTHDVHEVLLHDIPDRCYSFVSLIPRTPTASIVFSTNSRIGGGPNRSCPIPDFQPVLTKYVERRRAKETIKWIGECGFSQGDEEIMGEI